MSLKGSGGVFRQRTCLLLKRISAALNVNYITWRPLAFRYHLIASQCCVIVPILQSLKSFTPQRWQDFKAKARQSEIYEFSKRLRNPSTGGTRPPLRNIALWKSNKLISESFDPFLDGTKREKQTRTWDNIKESWFRCYLREKQLWLIIFDYHTVKCDFAYLLS